MRTHERFGDFLLLKKLSEDPLGEVFRAGRLTNEGVDQVLLLRVFNGSAAQGLNLGPSIQRRRALHQTLRSPNLAHGADAGEHQGVPFVAYDYISGKDLATLLEQAVRRSSPVPSEHALLIVERLALGLTVAYGTRLENQRVTHGFLVPELVMLSNEGENRLLGFEVSEALRAAARPGSPLGQRFGRYLSPEALQGQALTSTDDVYSLGVILLELLIGRPIPHPSPAGHTAEIERVASLGFPKIASLIERSLQPATERIGDVVTWHKTLDQLIRESNTSSTPFHLAFYMHNLFREDIERESAEIQTEKTMDFSKEDLQRLVRQASAEQQAPTVAIPIPAPAAGPAPPPKPVPAPPPPATAAPAAPAAKAPVATAPPPAAAAVSAAPPAPAAKTEPAAKHAPAKSAVSVPEERTGIGRWLLAAALLLVLGGGGFYAWWALSKNTAAGSSQSTRAAGAPLLQVIDERALDAAAAQQAAAAAATEEPAVDQALANVSTAPEPKPPSPSRDEIIAQIDKAVSSRTQAVETSLREQYDKEIQALRDQLQAAEADRLERERALREAQAKAAEAQKQAAAKTEESTTTDATSSETAAGGAPAVGTSTGTTATQAPTAASPAPATTAPAEPVRLGQLVTYGTGVVQPRLKTKPQPIYPMVAKRLRREAVVDLEVLVDEDGNVIDTKIDKEVGYGFDEAASRAAKNTNFFPATKNGVRVKMWVPLKIAFTNE